MILIYSLGLPKESGELSKIKSLLILSNYISRFRSNGNIDGQITVEAPPSTTVRKISHSLSYLYVEITGQKETIHSVILIVGDVGFMTIHRMIQQTMTTMR